MSSHFTLTALFHRLSLTRIRLFDLLPIARETLTETLRDGVLVLDTQDRIISANPAAQRLLLHPAAWLMGKKLDEALPRGSRPLEEPSESSGYTEVHWDDPPSDLEVNISQIKNRRGNPTGRLIVFRDITVTKQAAMALRDSEALYHTLVETLPLSIFRKDFQGRYTFANQRYCRDLGKTLPEIVGKLDQDLHPPDLADLYYTADQQIITTGQSYEAVEKHHLGNGSDAFVQVVKTPIYDTASRIVGVQGLLWDITEWKKTEQALARSAREMSALYETSLDINSQPDLPALLHTITERAASLLDAKIAGLYLVKPDEDVLELVVSHNLPGDFTGTCIRFGEGIAGRVAQTGEPIMVEDYLQWDPKAGPYEALKLRRLLAVPLKRQSKVIGVIDIADDQVAATFTHDEIRLVSLFADQAAIAIENARLLNETSQHANRLAMLNRIGLAVTMGLDMQTVLRTLLEQFQQIAPVDCFYVSLYDQANELVTVPYYYENGQHSEGVSRDIQQNPGLTGVVIQTRKTLHLPDTYNNEFPPPTRMLRAGGNYARAYVGLPLILRDKVIGVLSIQSYQPNTYTQPQIQIMEMIAVQAAIAIENARLYSEVQRLSIVDELTGVYNYRGLLELGSREIERARRFRRSLSAFFFDIDNFRDFNNRYSHATGNLVLRAVAQRSRAIVRAVDLVARYGGEEFVILLPEVNLTSAAQIAERLRVDIEQHRVTTEHGELGVTVSIGVAELDDQVTSLTALIDCANQAEHTAKETGKNRVVS